MASHIEKDGELACIRCGACLPNVYYFLPIPDMLEQVYRTKIETDVLKATRGKTYRNGKQGKICI